MKTKAVSQLFSRSVLHRNVTISNKDYGEEASHGTAFITFEQITDGNTDALVTP